MKITTLILILVAISPLSAKAQKMCFGGMSEYWVSVIIENHNNGQSVSLCVNHETWYTTSVPTIKNFVVAVSEGELEYGDLRRIDSFKENKKDKRLNPIIIRTTLCHHTGKNGYRRSCKKNLN
jgi:hypothetical protein